VSGGNARGVSGGEQRWYERLGVQINHPPPEEPKVQPGEGEYQRPPMWVWLVAPAGAGFCVQFGVFVVVIAALAVAGLDSDAFFLLACVSAAVALYVHEAWWRRTHPPSQDRPYRWFWRRRARPR
jgi:hypothetical protein